MKNISQRYGVFEQAASQKRWCVIPLCHPQFLHHRHSIRALKESKRSLGSEDEVTLIASKAIVSDFGPQLLAELRALTLGNGAISELDYLICRENKTPRQATEIWFSRKGDD